MSIYIVIPIHLLGHTKRPLSLSLFFLFHALSYFVFVSRKMSGLKLKSLKFILLMALLVWPSCLKTCNARKSKQNWRPSKLGATSMMPKERGHGSGSSSSTRHHDRSLATLMAGDNFATQKKAPSSGGNSATFNVLHYGAKGDGKADDTQVFPSTISSFSTSYYIFLLFCFSTTLYMLL